MAFLRPLVPYPKRDEVALSHNVLERLARVGKYRGISLEVIDKLLRIRDADIGCRLAVPHKVGGEELSNGGEVPGVYRLPKPIRKRLVLFLERASWLRTART